MCLGCSRSDFPEVLKFPGIFPLTVHVILSGGKTAASPPCTGSRMVTGKNWCGGKNAAGAVRGKTLQRTITKFAFKEKEISL